MMGIALYREKAASLSMDLEDSYASTKNVEA